jgi:hypothetical protein
MNRYLNQFFYSFFTKPALIAGKLPLSAAAAVGTVAIKGIASITKTGTGEYTITFDDKHYSIQSLSAGIVDSSEDLAISFESINLSAKTIKLITKVAGVDADVADACDIYLSFLFNDSSVN